MTRLLPILLAIVASPLAAVAEQAQVSSSMNEIDWPAFMHRNDMVWPTLPDNWNCAPFIGSGRLGAILWQNETGDFRIEVSRSDLYDHRRLSPGYGGFFARERLPNGSFTLAFGANGTSAPPASGSMRLDLWNAEITGQIDRGNSSWQLRTFATAVPDVIVLEIETRSGGNKATLSWQPQSAGSTRTSAVPKDYVAYPPQTRHDVDGINVSVQEMPEDRRYHTEGLGPGQFATAWKEIAAGAGRQLFLITTQITYPGAAAADHAVDEIRRAEQTGLSQLETIHRSWWHSFYRKSFLSIPDGSIESFYWIQMYKMGSTSRKGGEIIDLMGPWFSKTNWPQIWWNLNIQLTYWPFYMSNHLDEAEPLGDTIWNCRAQLAKNAAPFSSDSFAIGRATGPDCEQPVGNELGNLPWALHNLWLYYRSSMDDGFLRDRLFPLMKGSFRYLRHIAVEQPDGKLGLPPTASPEYTNAAPNCSYTLACFRWLATTLIEADARLKTNDPIAADCHDVLSRLVSYPVDDKTGIEVGEGIPFTHSHRHWSHLFMIYPFYEWDWSDPAHRALMQKSLTNWTDRSSAFAGFSWVGAASMWAAEGDGNKALNYLKIFLAKSPLPNTLYREGNPVIETPLACARTIQELLMTSHGDRIRVFPAIPSAWPDVAFADMRAEGAFLVSAKRSGGVTQWVTVKSLAGAPCRVSTSLDGTVSALPREHFKIWQVDHDTVGIDLAKGETVTLYDGDRAAPTDLGVSAVPRVGAFKPWGRDKSAVPMMDEPALIQAK